MTTIQFPREPDDALFEFIAEKARVCGGGAYSFWEGLCTRFALPVVELAVWYGSMPESNGKTNWTAILYRKGGEGSLMGALSDGITIERSEYPDRVRYEADRIRFLIGELTCEPDILAYDADAHSGYLRTPVKYDDTLLPFLALMRNELHANSHKGDREGWRRMTLEQALDEIRHHSDKLIIPVMNHDQEAIREHAADVANCAMMLADIAGVLSRE